MASNPANTTVNFFGARITHMPKLFTIKTKYVRVRLGLMTRSVIFTTGGSLIFVLQADKISPKTQKGGDRFRYLHTKNTIPLKIPSMRSSALARTLISRLRPVLELLLFFIRYLAVSTGWCKIDGVYACALLKILTSHFVSLHFIHVFLCLFLDSKQIFFSF